MNTEEQVKQIISGILQCDAGDIGETELLSDLGLTSVDLLDLVFGLEKCFKVEITSKDLKGLTTVNEIVSFINGDRNV